MTVHGLASSIRSADESETFDLGGHDASSITNIIVGAFSKPFSLEEMIRITFVVGAGKQARQKYDGGAAKAVTSELTKLGYEEDRGASCVLECAGSFKLQHDTAKNLKTVVVFPMVSSGDRSNAVEKEEEEDSLIPENSPGWKIAVSSISVFHTMLARQCPSWSQKKGCLGCIEALKEMMMDIEDKLMKGTPLAGPEQSFYDSVTDIDEKETYLRNEMHEQVEKGNITKYEQELLLQHNSERISSLEKENKSTAKAVQRKELLEQIEPVSPHPLRLDAEIRALQKEIIPLLQLEQRTKGRLLSVQETQTLARKEEIVEEIEYLEERSRGWFEDDEEFESRLEASRKMFEAKKAKEARVMSVDSGTVTKASASKWVLPGEGRGKGRRRAAQRPKGRIKGADVFSAMMMDSSSDEESEDESSMGDTNAILARSSDQGLDHHAQPAEIEKSQATQKTQPAATKKSKKKKKKKKKQKQAGAPGEEEAVAEENTGEQGTRSRAAPGKEEESEKNEKTLVHAFDFIKSILLPLIVGFVTWLISLVFGKPKTQRRPRR